MSQQIAAQDDKLIISGQLNFTTVPPLWSASLPILALRSTLYFDFKDVTSSNSAGLALLLAWLKYAKQHQKSIRFSQLPTQVMSIIKVAGLEKILLM